MNGETTWIHSSFVKQNSVRHTIQSSSIKPEESSTSKLGHIRSGSLIYKTIGDVSTAFNADTYTNAVYYIKKQATVGNQLYYLISTQASSTDGVVGWMKAEDLNTRSHVGIDTDSKNLYVKGNGSAYSKAWGGTKDLVYEDLTKQAGKLFKVNKTEKVGSNIWYRGVLNGKTAWLHSSFVVEAEESSTSRLGHIRSGSLIYKTIGDVATAFNADTYTNAVYYIKKQATVGNQLYYLISTQASSTDGVVGWMKAEDLNTRSHVGIDTDSKNLYVKGNGSAYSKAWGGTKDLVYEDLTKQAGKLFKVNKTEKVGSNIWYRGVLNGKTAWLHSSFVVEAEESSTSRLGHIRSGSLIYKTIGDVSTAFNADTYTNAVYYIKKQATVGNQLYYLISTQASSTDGVVGWMKAEDLNTHYHVGIDTESKTLYVKGNGSAYSKAWGGSKDLVFKDLSKLESEFLLVNKTERVGNNIWYRGTLNGELVWIHEAYVSLVNEKSTYYNITLSEALNMQMKAAPQTDKPYAYVSADYINKNNQVTASKLNVRSGPSVGARTVGQLVENTTVNIISKVNNWYQIEYKSGQWVDASKADVLYYLNPDNFINHEKYQFQFLDLSRSSDTSPNVLNNYLKGKGILEGLGEAFIQASNIYGVSDIYLLSHALLETGHGTSELATGVEVGKDSKGNLVLVNSSNVNSLTDIKKTYNMFGINAVDNNALQGGAFRAYNEGWFTPKDAIIGGADFIGNKYIKSGQNTLYKMRWNPESMANNSYASHQYATDIGWAAKQIYSIYNLYQDLQIQNLYLDIPSYKK
ncbi:hypothetical protein BME96_16475 [Virgibacillus halodenitrificans]|uniref:SH3 domain-containing protein n=1 Tax=Virgibacillus halodenitrificans TaxID=1482 RepID=A0AAC9J4J6_VIRHA|nr:hypothetical protein BME96_16475 [Virgibacillus halodenitrificans]